MDKSKRPNKNQEIFEFRKKLGSVNLKEIEKFRNAFF